MKNLILFVFLFWIGPALADTPIILDVRTKAEFDGGHVEGAKWVDYMSADFSEKVQKLDKSKQYKVYCAAGGRAAKAAKIMKDQGFKDVENLGGLSEAAKKLKANVSK